MRQSAALRKAPAEFDSRFSLFLYQEYLEMRKFAEAIVQFVQREDGPTAVEYAVMLALIIVVCISAITTLGTKANSTFTSVGTNIGGTSS
jgi:pilus assembly protein Flp/PilA